MIVCNHTGFIEVLALIASPLNPSFTPKEELRDVPLVGDLCRGL